MQHHAYLYEGSAHLFGALVQDAREHFGFTDEHDPNVYAREWEKFGIDESRGLVQQASLKSSEGRSLYILGIAAITTEAQQALLKLFEEPQLGAIFVVLMPHGMLLSTLRSRVLPYPNTLDSEESHTPAKKFLSLPQKERSLQIAAMLKDDEGVKERARDFMNMLEAELYTKLPKAKDKKELLQGLSDIALMRSYLSDRSPSLKMLLESLAATLPTL